MFPANSRYVGVEIADWVDAQGRHYRYLRRRFIPPSSGAVVLAEHTVSQNERPDLITARYLGDPEQFWRVCDANYVLQPDELTATLGRRLRIPLPQGG